MHRANAEHFHGRIAYHSTFTDLLRRFRILLGANSIFTKNRWLKRSRLWRFVLLMDPKGFFDPTPGLAHALGAQRVLPTHVGHLKRREAQGWRSLLVARSKTACAWNFSVCFGATRSASPRSLCRRRGLAPRI